MMSTPSSSQPVSSSVSNPQTGLPPLSQNNISMTRKAFVYGVVFLVLVNAAFLIGNLFWYFDLRGNVELASDGRENITQNRSQESGNSNSNILDTTIGGEFLNKSENKKYQGRNVYIKEYDLDDIEVIKFEPGTSYLTIESQAALVNLDNFLRRQKEVSILVTGHTDNEGSRIGNLNLSLTRAKIVREYLLELGLEEQRIKVSGAGDLYPTADNSTPKGREANRRVEITFVEKR